MPEGWSNYTKVKEVGSGSFGKALLVTSTVTSSQSDTESEAAPCEGEQMNVKDGGNGLKSGQQFIIKTINLKNMNNKQRQTAINEVKLLAACRHPYIINYRESFIEKGELCIVMDYADGGDFAKVLSKQRRSGKHFSEDQILRWLTQLVLAIRYMHEKHVLHRDLKPHNFFLNSNGRIKIGDFGIARLLESTCAFANTQIGTPYYLSPEICGGSPYTFSSDIWSLGCVLYEMTNLKLPFAASDLKTLMGKITSTDLTSPISSVYSPELRSLCLSMLNKDSAQRPSAEQICRNRLIQQTIQTMLSEEKASKGAKQLQPTSPNPNSLSSQSPLSTSHAKSMKQASPAIRQPLKQASPSQGPAAGVKPSVNLSPFAPHSPSTPHPTPVSQKCGVSPPQHLLSSPISPQTSPKAPTSSPASPHSSKPSNSQVSQSVPDPTSICPSGKGEAGCESQPVKGAKLRGAGGGRTVGSRLGSVLGGRRRE